MDRIDKILRYFDPQRFIEVCEARFDTLRTQVVANLQTKTGSSGKRVNSLGVPDWATGATAASLQTQVEQNDDGFEAAFVGRQGIAGVDETLTVYAEDDTTSAWTATVTTTAGNPISSVDPV